MWDDGISGEFCVSTDWIACWVDGLIGVFDSSEATSLRRLDCILSKRSKALKAPIMLIGSKSDLPPAVQDYPGGLEAFMEKHNAKFLGLTSRSPLEFQSIRKEFVTTVEAAMKRRGL